MRKIFGFGLLGMMASMLTGCSLNSLNGLINGSGLDINALIEQAAALLEGSGGA
jgi:hypothetical protein